jgi:transaldolase
VNLADLRVEIFADGGDLGEIERLAADPLISGFTTNPTLMKKAGVSDYVEFARAAAALVGDRPISFEVFSDEFDEMERQAHAIASWGDNIFVKVPVTDTRGRFSGPVVRRLTAKGIKTNVTALMTCAQVEQVAECLERDVPAFVSVFAGRIADTGRDPMPIMRDSVAALAQLPQTRLIWSSPRELLNIFQADAVGCHVITATTDVLAKLTSVGKDLDVFSRETVQMFYDDALAAAFVIDVDKAAPAVRTTA